VASAKSPYGDFPVVWKLNCVDEPVGLMSFWMMIVADATLKHSGPQFVRGFARCRQLGSIPAHARKGRLVF
jgi:hypothetical protein